MSKIHILESDNNFSYKVGIHFPIPTGNNSVGLSWKSVGLLSRKTGDTIFKEETETGYIPWGITQIEYDSIIAGDTVEIIETITPGLDPSNVDVEALAEIYITEWNARMASVLKYYGHTIEGA